MKQFLVVQHTYSEYLGGIEKQLENRDIGFVYQRPFTGSSLPASALQYDALWLLGGAHAVTDLAACPWIGDELRLLEAFRRARRPVIGIGFGGLLVAQGCGGTPHAEPLHDAHWTTAHATAAGRNDPLARAVDGRRVLVMVNGRVDLPPAIAPVAVDDAGNWIAVRCDALTYGLLFRPELKPGMLEDMIMEEGRLIPDDIGELLATARSEWRETQHTTMAVIAALVQALDLMRERRKMPVFALNPVHDKR
ncbi:MAG: GMP synthase [Betaproteobacteria bacterium]|nr:GMP synthase [Betaproteobacteria bacterium]MBI3057487.1 GMP synthase [Betaproteobacteria bacterium]